MFFIPSVINLKYIKVNTMEHGSNLSTGSNMILNRNNSTHKNEGFGEQNADSVEIHIPISFVDDTDMADSLSLKK
ncbi:hypothetical protein [Ectobacillus ponti]|uniref:Uncharacterized protein n=1 Tax=Ectobacillus ponti TaxID=2961894 RepID=A0AA41XAJ6_9BACI|nr:hypothetical protein [Ectobacillus ponti]MCP8969293.1 hypothetical protein [Ectobacillus ponti]